MAKKKPAIPSDHCDERVDLTRLASQARLRDLRLLKSASAVSLTGPMPPEVTQTISAGIARVDGGKALLARISFSVSGANADGSEGLRVEATFALIYDFQALAEATEKETQAFCQVVGLNNIWPYWREFVQSMTSRLGLPPLRVPLLRLDQLVQITDQDQERNGGKPPARKKQKTKP